MRSPWTATFRRSLLIFALLTSLALPACGGSDDATTEGAATGTAKGEVTVTTTGGGPRAGGKAAKVLCKAQLSGLLGQLDRLRIRLATGLSYEQYAAAVKKARAAYAGLDAKRLPPECLVAAGTDLEKSFNRYIEAANAWGECLADAGCNARVVEPELQRDWQVASHWLSEAHEGLKGIS